MTCLIAAMDGLLQETSSCKYVWLHFSLSVLQFRGIQDNLANFCLQTPSTKQSQQRPDYLMVQNIILPDFPVM